MNGKLLGHFDCIFLNAQINFSLVVLTQSSFSYFVND